MDTLLGMFYLTVIFLLICGAFYFLTKDEKDNWFTSFLEEFDKKSHKGR